MKLPSGIKGALKILHWLRLVLRVQATSAGFTSVALAPELWPGFYWATENALDSHLNSPWQNVGVDWAYDYDPDEDDDDDF